MNTFTTAYNRTEESVRDVNVKKFEKPSKVKSSLSYAVDINQIYKQYCKTGNLPLNGQQPIYDENFVAYNDLIEAQDIVNQATSYFAGLPANIKNQYGNDMFKFIKALNNKDEFLVKEGLLKLPDPVLESKPTDPVNPDIPVNPSQPVQPVENAVNTATTD